jgi:hypothetical protein
VSVLDTEQGPMAGAKQPVLLSRQIVVHDRQRPAGMRADIDIAVQRPVLAHHKAGEQGVALPEAETLGPRLVDALQRAERRPRLRAGRVQANPPMVMRQGRTVLVSNRPAAL